jgi:transcription initiation factor IIE alpha subunit
MGEHCERCGENLRENDQNRVGRPITWKCEDRNREILFCG